MVNRRNGLYWFDLLIAVVAGVWTLFHLIWSIAGQTSDDYWGIALLILFLLALIVAFVHFAQERPALRAESSAERFPEPAISKFFLASVGSAVLWFVVRMYVGTE
jgi:thiosulfate dehydrogenase (quinone) large subunit